MTKKINQSKQSLSEIEMDDYSLSNSIDNENKNNSLDNELENDLENNSNQTTISEEENRNDETKKKEKKIKKRPLSPLHPEFFKLKQRKEEKYKRWYMQFIVFIISIICLVTNIFGIIIFEGSKDETGWFSILVFGVFEGFLFLFYALIKFILRIEKFQQWLKHIKCTKDMVSCCIKEYDDEKYILKIPNVEKTIEEYICYQSDHPKEKNIPPIKRLYNEYKKFCHDHDTHFKVLSGTFLGISILISLTQMFLYNQAVLPFNNQLTKVFTFTVIIIIDYTLLFLFTFKVCSIL